MPLNNFDTHHFLEHYWQKQPLLIKNAWPDFEDPITAEELAGLSLEDDIDSRLIQSKPKWSQISGPLPEDTFATLSDSDWTLLVQSVETWIPELRSILEEFSFIPRWRMDDLMISYAVPGGTVGPHLDQYDVFLLQGTGQRHWQVGEANQSVKEHLPHPLIRQIEPFDAIIDEVLEPGDLLYIPPNTPHYGVALDNCLTYSIGFRAPSQHNLLEQLLVDLLNQDEAVSRRYQDTKLNHLPSNQSAQQLPNDIVSWSRSALNNVSDEQLIISFGQLVTRLKNETSVENELSIAQLEKQLKNTDADLVCHPDIRLTHYSLNDKHWLFVNGECFPITQKNTDWIDNLCQKHVLFNSSIKKLAQDIDFINTIAILLKRGWLLFNQ